jgi:L-lactate dehydrogenase (cytochrome)
MRMLTRMLRTQMTGDLRSLSALRDSHFSDESRAARCANIYELRRLAQRSVPRVVFDFIDGGAADEVTVRRNSADFARVTFNPRILNDVSTVDTSTSLFGSRLAMPLVVSPTGGSALLRYEGECVLAKAASAHGVGFTLSAMSSWPLEDVAQFSNGSAWFQLYLWRDRSLSGALVERAASAGYQALVLTVDTPVIGIRERDGRNRFSVPPRITARSVAQSLVRPRWARSFLREAPLNGHVSVGGGDPQSLAAYIGGLFDPSVTWKDIAWLRDRWSGPLLIKGVIDPRDAHLLVEAGVDGVIVSNHGGRQLDHSPSAISALAPVVEAVGGRVPVLLDGGVRRGSDILKAIAIGASACMTGRPLLYGLGAAGEAGVARALELLQSELRIAMALTGSVSIDKVGPSLVNAGERLRP